MHTYRSQKGGVILEYILVTTFTLAAGAAALSYLMKLMKDKMENLENAINDSSDASWTELLDEK